MAGREGTDHWVLCTSSIPERVEVGVGQLGPEALHMGFSRRTYMSGCSWLGVHLFFLSNSSN